MIPLLRKIYVSFFVFVIASLSAYAEGNYTNTLMALEFAPSGSNAVNMTVITKSAYTGVLSVTRKDTSTYLLTLPDTDSSAPNPDLSQAGQISNVSIRTMPSSDSTKGYTRITVKTVTPIELYAKNSIFTQDKKNPDDILNERRGEETLRSDISRQRRSSASPSNSSYKTNGMNARQGYSGTAYRETKSVKNNQAVTRKTVPQKTKEPEIQTTNASEPQNSTPDYSNDTYGKDSTEGILLILGAILIAAASVFFYTKAKNRMTDLAGERLDIEIDENKSSVKKNAIKKEKHKSIGKAINELDKKYQHNTTILRTSEYTEPSPVMSAEKSTDDMDIVDLDALFNEQKSQDSSEENDALEDFLSEFSFEETESHKQDENQEELYKIDEEEYNKVMNSKTLKFNERDIDCIGQIINSEIDNNTLSNINKYLVSNPIKQAPRTSLDELVAAYTISQNITFTQKDINALQKIMNVELDQDFITDLRTDPERTKAMEKQILDFENFERKKPSEIITLKVADLLPNLSDVLANPSKYDNQEVQKAQADESSLLKNIENVTFKPFDDGSRNFEIINDFSDEPRQVIELYSDDFLAEKMSKKEDLPKKIEPINTKTEIIKQREIKPASKNPIEKQTLKRPVDTAVKSVQNNVKPQTNNTSKEVNKNETIKCIMDGKSYTVLSSVAITKNIGCHLAKDDEGYSVLSYSGNKIALLKSYSMLKSEKIQARLSDKLPDGAYRFIIRIGNVKFIAELKKGCLNYVMDL